MVTCPLTPIFPHGRGAREQILELLSDQVPNMIPPTSKINDVIMYWITVAIYFRSVDTLWSRLKIS